MALLVVITSGTVAYQSHQENNEVQAAATTYPDHIVNGGFEYWDGLPNMKNFNGETSDNWLYISIVKRKYGQVTKNDIFDLPSNFKSELFGWKSTQPKSSSYCEEGAVQVNCAPDGNHYADLVADTVQKCIYQDISTTVGSVYKWQLRHASTTENLLDQMQVCIGPQGQDIFDNPSKYAQNASRTQSPGAHDYIGNLHTSVINTKWYGRNNNRDASYWDVYEGVYVPTSAVTTFTFNDVNGTNFTSNWVDDITFTIADPLRYDLNGGTGNLPAPQASGTYPGYYQRGTSVTLSDIIPTRSGYTFLGWSKQKHADIANTAIPANVAFIKQKQIEAGDNYVYAVWAKNPTITFKDSITGNAVSTVQLPYNTSVAASDIPSVPDHAGYRFTGYSTAPTSKFIQDTEIELQYKPAGRIQVNVEWIDRDNLAGSREDLQLSIPQAADPSASHDITISKDADTVTIPYLPSVNDPKEEIDLSAESKYELASVSISKITDANGITTIIYNISVKYIPTSDLVIMKLWDDDNDRYQERPSSITVEIYCDDVELPADTDEEFSEDDHWRLYDTIVISQDPEDPDSDSWEAVVHDVPLWSSRGYSGDVLVDAHYKIKELPVQGYDLISYDGSVQDGFRIENKVFGHVSIPSTGSNSHAFVIALTLAVVSFTAAFALISILRSRKSTRTL